MAKFEPMPKDYIRALSEAVPALIIVALRLREWIRAGGDLRDLSQQ